MERLQFCTTKYGHSVLTAIMSLNSCLDKQCTYALIVVEWNTNRVLFNTITSILQIIAFNAT